MRFGIRPGRREQLDIKWFAAANGFRYSLDLDLSDWAVRWQDCMAQVQFSRSDTALPLLQGLQTRRVVTADHLRSLHAQQLMPGCRTVAVTGDPELALRLLYAKWELQPPPKWHAWQQHHPNTSMLDLNIAAYDGISVESVTDQRRDLDWRTSLEKTRRWHDHHRTDPTAFRLDFQSLFDPHSSETVYHDMASALDIEPNWPAVRDFIAVYNAAQPQHLI